MMYCNSFPIIWRDEITLGDLNRVINREVAALRVPNYFSEDMSREIAERLIGSELYGRYVNAPQIGRVGQAFFESQASETSKARYEANAVAWMREIREGCSPFLSPIDKFRVEMDEVWPPGTKLGSLSSCKLFAGLARHFDEGSEAEPHNDVLAWDAPGDPDAEKVISQLAWNTYLKVPEEGGELTLWDVWPTKDEYEDMRVPGSYGLQRGMLPEAIASIKPEVGEMIIFDPARVHAVEKIIAGSRVTWSCFAGYMGDAEPLMLWS